MGVTRQPVLAIAAMAALLLLTLLGPLMTMDDTGDGAGSLYRQIGYLAIAGLSALTVRPLRHPERLLAVPWPLVAALAWCWISVLWALFPGIALRRIALTTVIIWSLFVLVRQLGYERTLLMLRIAFAGALLANFVAVLGYPEIGVHQADGDLYRAWRGVMMHKNVAGAASAVTVVLFAFDRRTMPVAAQTAAIIGAAIFLWFSASRTALAAAIVAVLAGALVHATLPRLHAAAERVSRRPALKWTVLLLPVAIALVAIAIYADTIAAVIDDPAAFSGRTLIWNILFQSIRDNPVLGVGYGSFWNVGPTGPAFRYANFKWVIEVAEGHNGYLDLLATVGVPGLALVLFAAFLRPLRQVLRTAGLEPGVAALAVAALVFVVVQNWSESTLFDRDSIVQVVLVAILAMLNVRTGALRPAVPILHRAAAPPPKRPSRLRL